MKHQRLTDLIVATGIAVSALALPSCSSFRYTDHPVSEPQIVQPQEKTVTFWYGSSGDQGAFIQLNGRLPSRKDFMEIERGMYGMHDSLIIPSDDERQKNVDSLLARFMLKKKSNGTFDQTVFVSFTGLWGYK